MGSVVTSLLLIGLSLSTAQYISSYSSETEDQREIRATLAQLSAQVELLQQDHAQNLALAIVLVFLGFFGLFALGIVVYRLHTGFGRVGDVLIRYAEKYDKNAKTLNLLVNLTTSLSSSIARNQNLNLSHLSYLHQYLQVIYQWTLVIDQTTQTLLRHTNIPDNDPADQNLRTLLNSVSVTRNSFQKLVCEAAPLPPDTSGDLLKETLETLAAARLRSTSYFPTAPLFPDPEDRESVRPTGASEKQPTSSRLFSARFQDLQQRGVSPPLITEAEMAASFE